MTAAIRLLATIIFFAAWFSSSQALAADLRPAGLADAPGIWVNLWSYPEVADAEAYCLSLQKHGIRNLYVQTSRSNTEALPNAAKLGTLIDACHRHGIRVIAWSFSQLFDPLSDADKLIAAARFESPGGERIDAIAGNMEVNLAKWKVESYSQRLRQKLGANYPMVAVVFSPLNGAAQAAYTPWKTLDKYWDVIAPMTYWGGKHQKLGAYSYTALTIQKVRDLVERSDVEIHPIGDGMKTQIKDVHMFLRACRDNEATSASLYPQHKLTSDQLTVMSRYPDYFQPNSRFRLAAYRELKRTGVVSEPPKLDPSRFITRGEIYKLIVRQLFSRVSSDLSSEESFHMLLNAGLLPGVNASSVVEGTLNQPVGASEMYCLVAGMIDQRGRAAHRHPPRPAPPISVSLRRRMDSFFVPPAQAEATQPAPVSNRPLNYLDAAQIVLQARAGL